MALQQELGLRHNFTHLEHEALLGLYYTGTLVRKRATEFFEPHGLTDVQFNVLMLLWHQRGEHDGLSQVELARMMLVNRANVTAIVDRMEKAGLVRRRPVPGDRRMNLVAMTRKGKEVLARVEGAYMAEVRRIMSALNRGEQETLRALLARVRARLQPGE